MHSCLGQRAGAATAVGDSAEHGFRLCRIDIGNGDCRRFDGEAPGEGAADLAARR